MGAFLAIVGMYASMWIVVAWLGCGLFSGHLAAEKGRWGFWWFLMGILFGPIALIAAAGLPDKNLMRFQPSPKTHVTCPECAEFAHKTAKVCGHCGCKLIPELEQKKGWPWISSAG